MEKTSLILLILLIIENLFLFLLLLIWINRECRKCHKVKCIERILNKLCRNCKDKPPIKPKKEQVKIF